VAVFVWCWVRDSLGWQHIPSSFEDFQVGFLGDPGAKTNRIHIFLFAGVSWELWRTRNDWVFFDILVSHPQAYCSPCLWFPSAMVCPVDQGSEEEGGGAVDQATHEAPGALKAAIVV